MCRLEFREQRVEILFLWLGATEREEDMEESLVPGLPDDIALMCLARLRRLRILHSKDCLQVMAETFQISGVL